MLLSFASLLLPHRPFPWIATINHGLQVLLGLVCLYSAAHEKRRTRPIFINFAIFFLFSIPLQLSVFAGSVLFPTAPYATVFYHQYVNKVGYTLVLAFCVLYVAVDYFGRNMRASLKYGLTAAIILAFSYPLYFPYFEDPLRLYHRSEYVEFIQWNYAYDEATQTLGREPSDEELVRSFGAVNSSSDVQRTPSSIIDELEKYRPYFGGANATTFFWRPFTMKSIAVNAFLVFTIGVVLLFKFLRDYAHAAYVEKILQTFFVFCMFEILHHWSYAQSPSYEIYRSVFGVGQYVTIMILLAMVYVFSMRLRFVLTALGKYYEGMIAAQPLQVTRWRDEIDNAILHYFFKGKRYLGRLVNLQSNDVQPTNKQEHQP